MPDRICSIGDCARPHEARGWCNLHYRRWKRHGSVDRASAERVRPTCSIDGCEKPVDSWGWCRKHYRRWTVHGDPLTVLTPRRMSTPPEVRFWTRVDKAEGCWRWTGRLDRGGYGRFGIDGHVRLAHRLSYEFAVGPIPDGLTIDHTCHNADLTCRGGDTCPHRACVNPAHLEPVTQGENNERARQARRARRRS